MGIAAIHARIMLLTDRLLAGLDRLGLGIVSCRDPEHRSGILSFKTPDPAATVRSLRERGVVVSNRVRFVRAAVHLFNNEEDVDRLLTALQTPV